MDEIFDRLKNAHPKHKYLATGLILSELFGIIALIWYLKGPLTDRFLTSPPKAYSIKAYNPQKRYVVAQGDYLRGIKALPYSKIAVFITPGSTKLTINADKNGDFSFQVPKDALLGRFRITFANYDALKNIAWIKSYRVTIDPNNLLIKNLSFDLPTQAIAENN